jgi:hypothetical protein
MNNSPETSYHSVIIKGNNIEVTKSSIMKSYVQQQQNIQSHDKLIFQFMNPVYNPTLA